MLKYEPIDNTLNPISTTCGRHSLNIDQNSKLGQILPIPLIAGRKAGLEFWLCRDNDNPTSTNYVIAFRKTFIGYDEGHSDRLYKTLPVIFRNNWKNLLDFVPRFTKKMYIDPVTGKHFGVKGRDLNLNFAADMDKITNLGPNAWMFILNYELRRYYTHVYTMIAKCKGISRSTKESLLKYNVYIDSSGKKFKMCPLQFLLLSIDTINALLTNLSRKLPARYVGGHQFCRDYLWSKDFESELKNHWDQHVIDDYFNRIAANPVQNGICA